MQYKLVPMDKSHLPQVAALERACFAHPWSESLLEQELYNDMISLVVAEGEDGTVLGYGEVRAILDEGTLEKIVVDPRFRRQGVAEEILRAYLRLGQAHLAFLTLEVRESNVAAIGLYEKLGFQVVGRRKNYYREEHEDALLMTVEFDRHG
ncbi:ribosomal protein S18-alanine N-acetyltransferase [Flavonifractor hominis]|uniref:[Ribosomal protein bS18]-alanine N-acetyltransferase n=1 Tax=Flavonifractor hominis TaxID=3133178 RepID=A0ABV1EQ38_9FIRM